MHFKTNTPGASHQGGIWERNIRTIKAIFNKMAGKYSSRLDTAGHHARNSRYQKQQTIDIRQSGQPYGRHNHTQPAACHESWSETSTTWKLHRPGYIREKHAKERPEIR